MDQQVMTFDMCTLSDKGKVKFTSEGLDIIRALLMKWIDEAHRGEVSAREMDRVSRNPFGSNQAAYFRSARSFLTARLVSHLSPVVNLKPQLTVIREWAENTDVPDGWREALRVATLMEPDNGVLDDSGGGGGADCGGGDDATTVGAGRDGSSGATAAHPAAPRHNPPAGRGPRRPPAHVGRKP